jgi:hypothetical protein
MITPFELDQLNHYLLSPANIYWKKNSGVELLISEKNNLLNIEMINKLYKAGNNIEIRNSIDMNIIRDFEAIFNLYKNEPLLGNKTFYIKQILNLCVKFFIRNKAAQSELNQLCLIVFSTIKKEKLLSYVNKDFEFFIRAQNIASSYVLIAFILGYYDLEFLQNLFNNTINDFMSIRNQANSSSDVINLFQDLIKTANPSKITFDSLSELKAKSNLNSPMIFERLDGNGLNKIKPQNMNDLEIIFCTLCSHYGYKQNLQTKNIFDQIIDSEFLTKKSFIDAIKDTLGVPHVK